MTLWWIYFVPLWLLLQVIVRGGLYMVWRSAAGEITGRLGLAYCFLKDPNANNPKKILQFFKYLFYFYNKVMIQCKVGCQSSGHSPNPKGWLSFKKKKTPLPQHLLKWIDKSTSPWLHCFCTCVLSVAVLSIYIQSCYQKFCGLPLETAV